MRALFSIVGLLVVLAIVGMLARSQLSSRNTVKLPAASDGAAAVTIQVDPNANVQQQSQQIQQQFKAAAEAAVQQPRAMPDDQ